MRTPRCHAVELLLLLLLLLPFSGSATTVAVREPKAGSPRGLPASIAGVVVNEREEPVPGAEVEAAVSDLSWDPQRQRTRTDAAGRFLISRVEEGLRCSLRVSRSGFAPALLDVEPRGEIEIRLVLRPGATASGTVADEDGHPVQGARVELFPENDTQAFHDTRLYRSTSGADGRFEIPDLPEERFDLQVAYRGLSLLTREGVKAPWGVHRIDLGRLRLIRGQRRLAGQVVDPRGRPLAAVPVWIDGLWAPARDWAGEDDPRLDPVAVTGPDGRFEVAGLDPFARLHVCPPGYQSYWKMTSRSIPQPLRIVLAPAPPAARISGRVLDESGRPIPGARVRLGSPGAGRGNPPYWLPCQEKADRAGVVTDAAGRFSLKLPGSPGTFDLWATAPGYLREVRREIPVSRQGLDLVLSRGATLSGRVFAPDGSPAAAARVYAGQDGKAPETWTDAAGRYRLAGVQPGTRELWAEHPELGEARRRLEVKPGALRLDLTLDGQRERAVSGRVTGPGGEPLAGVSVQAGDLDVLTVYTRQDGSFRLVFPRGTLLLYEGDTPLRFTREGYAPAVQLIRAIKTPIEGLEIQLARGWPLTGDILGAGPESFGKIWVYAHKDGETREVRANPDGTYRFDDLEPGIWKMTASFGTRKARGAVEVYEGTANLDLRIPALREVRGRVLDPDGNPVSARVELQDLADEDRFPREALSQEDGSFSIELAEGIYRVQGIEKPVTVGDRPIDGLEIHLKQEQVPHGGIPGTPDDDCRPGVESPDPSCGSLTLAGHLDSGGEPLSTHVALLAPDGTVLIEDLIEDEEGGDFRFPALWPGTYFLQIKDYYRDRIVRRPIQLTSDQTMTIDLLHP